MEETTIASTQPETHKQNTSKKALYAGIIGGIAIVLIGYGVFSGMYAQKNSTPEVQEVSIARVNGVSITNKSYDILAKQIIAQYQAQGIDTEDPTNAQLIQEQILKNLIDEEVLYQEAEEQQLLADTEAVTARYEEVVSQFGGEEAFLNIIEAQGITKEVVLQDLERQLAIEAYLEQAIDEDAYEVTDEEAQALYDEVAETTVDIPPYEEVVEEVKQQVEQEKMQTDIEELVETLREEGEIEILL